MDTPGDSAPLRVRGIAVASPRANAFGTVQLACLPEGLEIVFSSVGGTSPGYAPGPLVRGVRVIVPYVQVHTIERDGALLHLEVDPSCTAYNRLSLVHLSTGLAPRPDEALDRRRAARESARIAATATWLPAVALAREVWAELSWAGIALVVVLAVAATLAAGELLARRIVLGGPDAWDRAAMVEMKAQRAGRSGSSFQGEGGQVGLLHHQDIDGDLSSDDCCPLS